MLISLQKGFLHHILGILAVMGDTISNAEQSAVVFCHEFFESIHIALVAGMLRQNCAWKSKVFHCQTSSRARTCIQRNEPYESAWDGRVLILVSCATSECGYPRSLYTDSSGIPTLH